MKTNATPTQDTVAAWEDGRAILVTGEGDLWLASGGEVKPASLKQTVAFWRNQQKLTESGYTEPTTYSDEAFSRWLAMVEAELP